MPKSPRKVIRSNTHFPPTLVSVQRRPLAEQPRELQASFHELRQQYDALERQGRKRTDELLRVNASLQAEITERRQAEEALKTNEERYRIVSQSTSDYTFSFHFAEDGRLVLDWLTESFARITGFSTEEIQNHTHPLSLYVHPDDLERVVTTIRTLSPGRPTVYQFRIVTKQGEVRWREASLWAVADDERKPVQVYGATRDITERKLAEEALQQAHAELEKRVQERTAALMQANVRLGKEIAERERIAQKLRQSETRYRQLAQEREQLLIFSDRRVAVGDLAASFAHEFNNPVAIILGFAQDLLREVGPTDTLRRRLEIIESEAQRCKRLVRDLVDFVRPAPTHYLWTDLGKLIASTLALVATPLRQQQIEIDVHVSPDVPQLLVDAQQLQQVLLNLFFNAMEAMPEGGVLGVQATFLAEGSTLRGTSQREVLLHVSDTGAGIASQDLIKIFQPFFTTKIKGGMGLGLSICESIVQAHGGQITVESSPEQGTRFSIVLPLKEHH